MVNPSSRPGQRRRAISLPDDSGKVGLENGGIRPRVRLRPRLRREQMNFSPGNREEVAIGSRALGLPDIRHAAPTQNTAKTQIRDMGTEGHPLRS